MHILLTDRLGCPRCGPEFGLILLADRIDERRNVEEGRLGCLNCREDYPIRAGEADFRLDAAAPPAAPEAVERGPDWALRLAALLGIRTGPAAVLLVEAPAGTAGQIAALVPGLQVISAGLGALPDGPPAERDRILVDRSIPLRSRSLAGAVLAHPAAAGLLDEAARVVAPEGRIVLDPAPPGAAGRLAARGLSLLLEQDLVVVASVGGAG
jgi:uncharacterized protein YbaR (Trm112 family)